MNVKGLALGVVVASVLGLSAPPADADVLRRGLSRRFPSGESSWCPTQFEDTVLGFDNPDGAATTFTASPGGDVKVTFLVDTAEGVRHFLDEVGVFARADYEAARAFRECFSDLVGGLAGWEVPVTSGPRAWFFTAFPGGVAPQWNSSNIDGAPHVFAEGLDGCFDAPEPVSSRPAFYVSNRSSSDDGTGSLAIGGPGISDGVVPVTFSLVGLTPGVDYVVTAVWGSCGADLTPENGIDDTPSLEVLIETSDPPRPGSCVPGEFTACAIDGRFEITAGSPRAVFAAEAGRVSPAVQGELGGAFHFFFAEKNFQVVVKISKRPSGFYAVSIAGLESFPMTIRIRDTEADLEKTYLKPAGELALPVDAMAFPVDP